MNNNILEKLKETEIFDEHFKKELLMFFDKLNQNHIETINEALTYEKQILLNFLKWLKENNNINLYQIKNNIWNLDKFERVNNEKIEKEKEDVEITNLLDNLEY